MSELNHNSPGDNPSSESWQEERYSSYTQRSPRTPYSAPEPVTKPKKKSPLAWLAKVVATALVFGLVAGGTMVGVDKVADHFSGKEEIETTVDDKKETQDQSGQDNQAGQTSGTITAQDITAVVENVMPCVVSITGKYQTQGFFGVTESEGAGSGFIIAKNDKNLLIATNNHVVAGSTELTVGFINDKTAKAKVVGTDSTSDLAVISVKVADIDKETLSAVKIATLGSSDNLKVGQTVIAIGNALGYGQSVTMGVISAKDREITFADGSMTLLQTDAAINPGNSGGVLIDTDGKVIGINNAKLEDTSVEGMCYAIPITTANTILTKLMNAEETTGKNAAFLGVRGKDINSTYSEALGMPSGLYVSSVVEGSPAEKAGIKVGDIITKLDGSKVATMNGLVEKLAYYKAGDKVKITIHRAEQSGEYKEMELEARLGKKADFKDADSDTSTQQSNGTPGTGDEFGGNGSEGNDGYNPYDDFFGDDDDSGRPVNPFDFFFNY